MLRIAPVSALVAALLVSADCRATIIDSSVNPLNGHTYLLLAPSTWTDAEAEAVSLGGHLATARSQAENDWLWDTFKGPDDFSRYLWIGLYSPTEDSSYVWVSGESPAYSNWAAAQPSLTNTGFPGGIPEHFVQMGYHVGPTPSAWNDLMDIDEWTGTPLHGVVEIVPEPSSLALTGLALVGFSAVARRRRRHGRQLQTLSRNPSSRCIEGA